MLPTPEDAQFLDHVRHLAAGRAVASMIDLALDLDLFAKIQGRSVPFDELVEAWGLPRVSTRFMAQFLCKEGLLTYKDGKLTNHPVVDKFLTTENLNRQGLTELRQFPWPKDELRARLLSPPDKATYQLLPDERFYYEDNPTRISWGEELAQLYDFKPHRVLLDVGSSSGGSSIGIRKHNPHLRGMLFDLPKVAPFAEKVIADAGMSDAITFHGGSFVTDELPRGADVALISYVLQDWRPEEVVQILRKILDALEPGGTLLILQPFFEDDWTGSMKSIIHAFFVCSHGGEQSYGEMEAMMTEAGFVDLERRHHLLIGRKKKA